MNRPTAARESGLRGIICFAPAQDFALAHIEDFAQRARVGEIDHVGIGSNFDGISGTVNGLEDVSKMSALVAVLLNRGYAESELKKIPGENFLRVVREVIGE